MALKCILLGNTANSVYQYTLGTAWNVSTATYASLSKVNAGTQEGTPNGFSLSSDGTKMFVVGSNQKIKFSNILYLLHGM
jgi:hypothetical protein